MKTPQRSLSAGNFNEWNLRRNFFLVRETDGWTCRIELTPGQYYYKFVDNREWILDPANNDQATDASGNMKSVIVVKP